MPSTRITGTRPIKDPELAREVDREMESARKRRDARKRTGERQNNEKESASNNGASS